jgi:two-component system KDP operon response regulator KdpE
MSGPRILVVDDEPQILRFLTPALEASGYALLHADTGRAALHLAANAAPDLVILDLGLPDMDGKEVLAKLRAFSPAPVIILSARDREAEKIAALDLGADDYVEKPFAIGELLARMRVALRHSHGGAEPRQQIEAEGLVIDMEKRLVTRDGEPMKLTPREYDLLCVLARNAGKVMTHRLGSGAWRGRSISAGVRRAITRQGRAQPRRASPYRNRNRRRLSFPRPGVRPNARLRGPHGVV